MNAHAMNLRDYFARPDAPSAESAVGIIMVKVLGKYPELDFDAARVRSHELLAVAAKGKTYRVPRVLSAAEIAERGERLRKAFGRVQKAA